MIEQFEQEELQRLIAEEVGEGDFVEPYLASVAKQLKKDMAAYRGFGPYWPTIKNLMVDRGLIQMEKEEDQELISELPEPLACAAAYAWYENCRLESSVYLSGHIAIDEEGEAVTFYVDDCEAEGMLAAKQIARAL